VCLAHLALLEALQGRLRRAAELTVRYETLRAEQRLPGEGHAAAAATAAAWISMERHELPEARRCLAQVEKADPGTAVIGPLLAVLHSRLRRANGDLVGAECALHAVVDLPDLPRWVREQVLAEEVRIRLARNDGHAGLKLLDQLPQTSARTAVLRALAAAVLGLATEVVPTPTTADAEPPPVITVETAILQTCGHIRTGNTSAAVAALERARHVAEPEALRRPFLDTPLPLRRLLRAHPRLADSAAWLNPTAPMPRRPVEPAGRPRSDEAATPVPVDKLSARELEVLRHLAAMLSTPEIAAAMFISVNTVRTHIRAILRKLVATGRAEAVRRARQLQLL
jgi:LuxR family transcriptional regulator, maltose regulon positive regulatory protein